MVKKRQRRHDGWVRRHVYSIACITLAVLLVLGSVSWYAVTTNDAITAQEASIAQNKVASVKLAQQAKEKREKLAAEAKAKQEAAAKDAAEQAKTGTTANADSKACNAASTHNNPASIDVVVNKKHCMQPLGYVPPDLTTSNGATLGAKAIAAYNQMFAAAAAAGQPFYVTSSYRSYNTQVSTYNHWVATSGQAGADTYSARPGYSEHQTGFAFDVAANGCTLDCFGSTSQYQWFQQNAANYGFIQRYYAGYESITGYKAEEWHYRYVGIETAKDMQSKGIKTLEQYWNISGGDY
ncbi:hypothetical protein BGO17_01565 [Candidatus Saccharibacteria bacterium 49-20]|nr:MAG: hypothetical protein BGO17_01565 [Candidatus Saccharibacteria bacterium 49-20]